MFPLCPGSRHVLNAYVLSTWRYVTEQKQSKSNIFILVGPPFQWEADKNQPSPECVEGLGSRTGARGDLAEKTLQTNVTVRSWWGRVWFGLFSWWCCISGSRKSRYKGQRGEVTVGRARERSAGTTPQGGSGATAEEVPWRSLCLRWLGGVCADCFCFVALNFQCTISSFICV